jgi:hypothetical protein
VLYCGATASLCALELLAHSAMLPADMIVVQARVPKSLSMQTVEESDLPPNWSSPYLPRKRKTSERIGCTSINGQFRFGFGFRYLILRLYMP